MDAQAKKKALYRAKLKAQKVEKRIDSPLVRYNESDQPVCRVCDIVLKSESSWQAHQVSAKHREAIKNVKASAAAAARVNNVKPEPSMQLSQPKPGRSVESSMSPPEQPTKRPSSVLPSDFFDKHETKRQSNATWKSADDPARGSYSAYCTATGYPHITLQNGSTLLSRSGPWNGLRFNGIPDIVNNTIYTYELEFNEKEVYYSFHLFNSSIVSRIALNPSGQVQRLTWVNRTRDWVIYVAAPIDNCDYYSHCGAYGSCNSGGAPICGCLNKFVPQNKDQWDNSDWTNGCMRKVALDCKNGDGFLKFERLKLPDTKDSWFNTTMTLEECGTVCLQNCSCTAYTNLDIRGTGSGCLLWFGDLIDIRDFSQGGQDEIFIRMASSDLEFQPND